MTSAARRMRSSLQSIAESRGMDGPQVRPSAGHVFQGRAFGELVTRWGELGEIAGAISTA